MFRKLARIFGIFLIFLICSGSILSVWEGVEYVSTDNITLAWDPSEGATTYEVRMLWVDQDPPLEVSVGETSETQMVIQKPRNGHFVIQVRACNDGGCSEWSSTSDPERTQIGKPFRVFFKPSGAGGLLIE